MDLTIRVIINNVYIKHQPSTGCKSAYFVFIVSDIFCMLFEFFLSKYLHFALKFCIFA